MESKFLPPEPGRIPAARPSEAVLALIDTSRLRRECLKVALGQHNPRWRIIDMASAHDALRLAEAGQNFQLLLISAATSEHIDIDEIESLRAVMAETPVVVVAESDNPHRARLILRSGTRGFLPTSLSLKVLMGALDLVMAGGVYVPSSLIETTQAPAAPEGKARSSGPLAVLTRRQRDVLNLIAQGKSNKLIADALEMSESTVKAHVKQIIRRLHVANRTQAALLATGAANYGQTMPTAPARPVAAEPAPAALPGAIGSGIAAR